MIRLLFQWLMLIVVCAALGALGALTMPPVVWPKIFWLFTLFGAGYGFLIGLKEVLFHL